MGARQQPRADQILNYELGFRYRYEFEGVFVVLQHTVVHAPLGVD